MPQRSVATVGGDYSGWDTAWAYLATIDPLVDDWEFIQTGDCTVNAWPDIGVAANRIDFNGHRVRFICPFSDSHQGDPTAGYMTFLNGANGIIDIRMAGAGGINDRFEAEGLNVEQQVSLFLNLFRVGNWVIGNVSSATYRNLMIKGANNGVGIQYACTTDYVRVSNIKAWNLSTALGTGPAGFIGGGPYNGRKYAEFITAYNCTGDGFGIYIHPEFDQEFRDCVAIDCVVNDFFFLENGGPPADHVKLYNSADADNTIVGAPASILVVDCLGNRVPANEFASLLDTDSDFLDLLAGTVDGSFTRDPPGILKIRQDCKFTPSVSFTPGSASLGVGGIAGQFETHDIKRNERPGVDDLYSIGAYEQQYS